MKRFSDPETESCDTKRTRGLGNSEIPLVDVENDGPSPMEKFLSTELALENLFDCLPFSDLLNCSLVCKQWYRLTRLYMKNSRRCLIRVIHKRGALHRLKELDTILRNYEGIIPFTGVSISVLSCDGYSTPNTEGRPDWVELKELLMCMIQSGRMKFHHLRLDLPDLSPFAESGPQIILDAFSAVLEEIYLKRGMYRLDRILGNEIPALPNLKKLYVLDDSAPGSLIHNIINASPFLKPLALVEDSDFESASRGTPMGKVILEEHLMRPMDEHLPQWSAFSRGSPKLKEFRFLKAVGATIDKIKEAWTIVLRILKSSQSSLREFQIDHYAFALLPVFDPPQLLHVTCLSVDVSLYRGAELNFYVLNKIDYSHYFPNLKKVRVRYTTYPQHCEPMNPEGYGSQFMCSTVSTFILEPVFIKNETVHGVVQPSWLKIFAETFPNVREFFMKRGERLGPFLAELWSVWPSIEHMTFSQTHVSTLVSDLEEAFRGVHQQENEQDLAIPEDVHIMPTSNKLESLERPRTLSIEVMSAKSSRNLLDRWVLRSPVEVEASPGTSLAARIAATEMYYRIPLVAKLLRQGHEELGRNFWNDVRNLKASTEIYFKRVPRKSSAGTSNNNDEGQ